MHTFNSDVYYPDMSDEVLHANCCTSACTHTTCGGRVGRGKGFEIDQVVNELTELHTKYMNTTAWRLVAHFVF
jgi:hypothetical protein